MRKRTGQSVQSAALIVQIQHPVVMVRVRSRDAGFDMKVPGDGSVFEHVERVIVHERNDAGNLGSHKEGGQAGTKTTDCARELQGRD